MATFKENNSFLLVCRMNVNQSVGLVRVRNADAGSLHCDWTLGNAGLSPAVTLFLIQELQLKCRYLFFFFLIQIENVLINVLEFLNSRINNILGFGFRRNYWAIVEL